MPDVVFSPALRRLGPPSRLVEPQGGSGGPAVAPLAKPAVRPEGNLTFSRVLAQLGTGLTLFATTPAHRNVLPPQQARRLLGTPVLGTPVAGAPAASQLALPFCSPFLVSGETVVAADGANGFNLYRLTEWARRKRLSSPALLNRLRIARAFTCFQLATILHHMDAEMERHQATRLVITGLPDCLYDEELSEPEARGTFARCRASLLRLAGRFTVLAFADSPAHPAGERLRFFDSLVALASFVYEVGNTEPIRFVPIKAPGLITTGSLRTKGNRLLGEREQ